MVHFRVFLDASAGPPSSFDKLRMRATVEALRLKSSS
jgi:hypothetical protein